jgi:hypothetical protein
LASWRGNIPVLEILIQECKRKKVAAYNWKDNFGRTPVFFAYTSSCIESFLNAGLDDLELVTLDGKILLHYGLKEDIVSKCLNSTPFNVTVNF